MTSPTPSPCPDPNEGAAISPLSRWAYEHGEQPIEHAASLVYTSFDAWLHVRIGRESDPAAFPGYGPDATLKNLSLRVVGHLLDAGWTPPVITPETAQEAP